MFSAPPPNQKRDAASPSDGKSKKAKKKPSAQEVKNVANFLIRRNNHMKQFNHTLNCVRNRPSVYHDLEFKDLREFCEYRDVHRNLFPPLMGDTPPLQPTTGGVHSIKLTSGYIKAIACCGDTSFALSPILQVVSTTTSLNKPPFGKTVFGKSQQSVKITHLRLLDGDNNTMLGRLAINITDKGKKLRTGKIIQLDLYTLLNHAVKEDDAPPKPVVYVSKFSLLGYQQLPPASEINDPMESTDAASQVPDARPNSTITPTGAIIVPECNYELCSLYGTRMLVCVCKANPVDKINLQTLKEECWFADEEVADMSLSHKRCML